MILSKDSNNNWTPTASGTGTFIGTLAAFNAIKDTLPVNTVAYITDDGNGDLQPVDAVTDGNMHPVTSNAVYDTLNTVTQGSATIVSSNVGATGEDCYVQFYKAGKIVMVRYRLYFNATPSFLEDIATGLPNAKAMNWPTCSNFLGQGSKPITWQANTDGVLRIDNGADNIVANSAIYGSFTYIAA